MPILNTLPERAEALYLFPTLNAFALTGRNNTIHGKPRALPWAMRLLGFQPAIIGCGSAIQASLIVFDLHDNSARPS